MKEENMAEVLRAVAHPSRIKILQILGRNQKCVKDLEQLVNIKQSNLSQHLRILKDRGIVECERRGMEVCYRIKNRKILDVIMCAKKFFTPGGKDDE